MLNIPNTTLADAYTEANTWAGTDVLAGGFFTVANNPAAVQLAIGTYGSARWQDEQYLPPATYPILGGTKGLPVSGIRARNFVAGSAVQFFGGLYYPDEPAILAGTPYDATISPGGGVSGAMVIPAVALADWPPASPVEGQVAELILPAATYNPLGTLPVRWLCTYDASNGVWHVKGPALINRVVTLESTASNVYTNLATTLALTVPRDGSYNVEHGASLTGVTAGNGVLASVKLGAAATSDNESFQVAPPGANGQSGGSFSAMWATALALEQAVQQYKSPGATTMRAEHRWLRVSPLTIT